MTLAAYILICTILQSIVKWTYQNNTSFELNVIPAIISRDNISSYACVSQ